MTHDSHDSHGASPGLRPRLLQRRGVVDIRKHVGRQYAKDAPPKLCGTFYLWDIIKTGKLYLSANGIASKSTRIPMLQMLYIYINFPLNGLINSFVWGKRQSDKLAVAVPYGITAHQTQLAQPLVDCLSVPFKQCLGLWFLLQRNVGCQHLGRV